MERDTFVEVPGMFLIGSMGRNSGKTVLACALIENLRELGSVIGLKVSTIHSTEKRCLRGGEGCGVCTSLEGEYCLTEETSRNSGKDTARMLAAGAEKVFWLRVRKGHLRDGIESFLEVAPPGTPIVCESNSLRSVVEPGAFVMMKQRGSEDRKTSADAVLPMVDRVVKFDGEDFELSLNDILFRDGRFSVRVDATLAVLAGGGSSRMGTPKSLLEYHGTPLLEYILDNLSAYFGEMLISANEELPLVFGGVRRVPDKVPGYGPIGGIVSCLAEATFDRVFVTACDIPTINSGLIGEMLRLGRRCDVVVPRTQQGFLEPLHALYRRETLPWIEGVMARGEKRIRAMYEQVKTCYIDLRPDQELMNINTPEEYRRVVRAAEESEE